MRNSYQAGTLLRGALTHLARRMPPGWTVELLRSLPPTLLTLRGPDGRVAEVPVVVRTGLEPRDVPSLVAAAPLPMLVLTPYLGARARELLAEAGVSYVDSTGNLRLVVGTPAIFIEGLGSQKDPDRAPRPLHSLRGPAAGRVVRALCEFRQPYGVRSLAGAAATPLGTVSRVVSFLEAEALLTRDVRKQIVSVDWEALLTRWAQDYGVTTSNVLSAYLEPRGLNALWPKLSRLPRYAATGSSVGTSVAPTRLAMLYVDDPDAAARTLDLTATESGANVWLLTPYDDVVFDRMRRRRVPAGDPAVDLATVSLPQAVVDLLTSPGRGPEEALALVERMRGNTDEWRVGIRP